MDTVYEPMRLAVGMFAPPDGSFVEVAVPSISAADSCIVEFGWIAAVVNDEPNIAPEA